jgi:hypothetical protein
LKRFPHTMNIVERPCTASEALSYNSEHLLRSENLPFDIDCWYDRLAPFTAETHFLPLTCDERDAIILAYRARYLNDSSAVCKLRMMQAVLEALEHRLDTAVKRFGSDGCFLRLCGRSPKDAEPHDRGRVRRRYDTALAQLERGPTGTELPAAKRMQAAAHVPVLRIASGAEAMSILLSSERVYSDLLDWRWYGEPEQICLRRWEDDLTLDHEFRLYINGGKLTAISQCVASHTFEQVGVKNSAPTIHPRDADVLLLICRAQV